MSRFTRSDLAVAALVVAAVVFGMLGFAGLSDEVSNSLLFVASSLTLLTLFTLAVRVPLRGSGSRVSAWATNGFIVGRRDRRRDCRQCRPVSPRRAFRRHPRRTEHASAPAHRRHRSSACAAFADLFLQRRRPKRIGREGHDRDFGAKPSAVGASAPSISTRSRGLRATSACTSYNTAVLQADDRRVLVENVTDVTRLGYAALRVLRKRAETICFVTGHGEVFRPIAGPFPLTVTSKP